MKTIYNKQNVITPQELNRLAPGIPHASRISRRRSLVDADQPYLMDHKDPAYKLTRDKRVRPKKVLTQNKNKRTLRLMVNRRKDGGMTKRQKSKFIQEASLALLAIAAVTGITELLGGELKHAVVSALFVALLYVHAKGE